MSGTNPPISINFDAPARPAPIAVINPAIPAPIKGKTIVNIPAAFIMAGFPRTLTNPAKKPPNAPPPIAPKSLPNIPPILPITPPPPPFAFPPPSPPLLPPLSDSSSPPPLAPSLFDSASNPLNLAASSFCASINSFKLLSRLFNGFNT